MSTTPAETDEHTVPAESFSPPYVSFKTLMNTVERMTQEGGSPSQIDRSYLSNLPGSTQTFLMAGMKALRLVDENLKPTEDLEQLVDDAEGRASLMETILRIHYPGPLGLGPFATQQQLEAEFRKFGLSGSTMRKAVGFFLAAARYADIPLSPHFKLPKAEPPESRARRRPAGATDGTDDAGPRQPPAQAIPPAVQHPLVQGLIRELPPPGTDFTPEQQNDWLELAKHALRVMYRKPGGTKTPVIGGGEPD